MELPSIGEIEAYFKKLFFKRCHRNLFSCWKAMPVIALLGLFSFGAASSLETLSYREFYFLTAKASAQNLFVKSAKNFLEESPEITLVQGNSLKGAVPPATVSSQVLGSLGGVEPAGTDDSIFEYLVEEGDTLSSVAQKFGISLNTILWANELSVGSVIKPGQKIIILPVSGALHLVENGDTLSIIAKKYKADLKEIIAFNNLSNEGDIFIGDVLIVPGGEMPDKAIQITTVPLAESYFIIPAEGKISQGLHGTFGNAVDISNKCGNIVVAAAGGIVQRVGYTAIGGNIITILHPNGVVTYYGHLLSMTVSSGQTVAAGQIIGYIGNTGYTIGTTGCHVHFEVRGAKNFLSRYNVGSYLSWKN